jgi:hypothetical protein
MHPLSQPAGKRTPAPRHERSLRPYREPMADAIIRAQVLRWVSDDQPGWIEVGLVDADGQEHRIVEKAPVLSSRSITAESEFPTELWLRADTGRVTDKRVEVTFAYAVETTEGLPGVRVRVADVRWL